MGHLENLRSAFQRAIRSALDKLQNEKSGEPVTDLFLYPNPESGEFSVLDDDRTPLAKVLVEGWGTEDVNSEAELEKAEPVLKDIFARLAQQGAFEKIEIQKPFSAVMVDDDMETLAEIFFLDDDAVSLDADLLKQVDKELGDFFRKLMSDF